MARFAIYQHSRHGLTYVETGFSIFAFLIPFIWALIWRLWDLAVGLGLLIPIGLGYLASEFDVPGMFVGYFLIGLAVGFTGSKLRQRDLVKRGYTFMGLVEAKTGKAALENFRKAPEPEPEMLQAHASSTSSVANAQAFSGERSLTSDAYKIFLAKKYQVEKSSIFDKYICQERLFETVDSALTYAHELEVRIQNNVSPAI